jgi:crotonobetainyl-CoA:carnitine CoA-transferase CaiB-like acyl-CoA transferase
VVEAYARDKKCPLDGVRVLDLSRLVAGNMLTHVLADLGADVVKVEPPEGDSLRAWKLNGVSVQWKVYARNKRSIALDLKKADDKETLRRLISSSQILVENFRPGVLDRLGFPLDELLRLQPKLVVMRISGWGQTGPYRGKPGFGTLVEAASGFAFKNGFPDREPLLPNLGLADSIAGIYGAAAVMVALRDVEVGKGEGQEIDLSLLEPILSILGADQAVFRATGQVPTRTGNRTRLAAPRNIYLTNDNRYLALSASTPEMAFRLFRSIGRGDLCDDPRFATNEQRVENVEELDSIIGAFVMARSLFENLEHFNAAEVTVGPIYDAQDVMDDPHVRERGSIVELEDAEMGSLPMHAVVGRFSATPGAIRRPAPQLDEHRAEILNELYLNNAVKV